MCQKNIYFPYTAPVWNEKEIAILNFSINIRHFWYRGLSFLQVQNAIFESLAIKTKTGISLDKSIKLKWKGMKDEINRNQSTFVYVYKEPHYIIVLLTVIEDSQTYHNLTTSFIIKL